jgi:hypothetical protein
MIPSVFTDMILEINVLWNVITYILIIPKFRKVSAAFTYSVEEWLFSPFRSSCTYKNSRLHILDYVNLQICIITFLKACQIDQTCTFPICLFEMYSNIILRPMPKIWVVSKYTSLSMNWPPLWSSGQSSWLQIRRPGFDSRHYQNKK